MTFIVQNCGVFFKKNQVSPSYRILDDKFKQKKMFLEDQHSNIVLRSFNSNEAEELMVISYADLFTPLFLPRL